MTGLLCLLQETDVCLAMDTLVSVASTKGSGSEGPLCYATKLHVASHLRTVICGTGIAALPLQWYSVINTSTVAVRLSVLNRLAGEQLPALAAQCGVNEIRTATIYQFGFLNEECRFAGFKYSSENDFRSERLQYGLIIKPPELANALNGEEVCDSLNAKGVDQGLFDLMVEMKRIDDANEGETHTGIGGEVHMLKMTQDVAEIRVLGQLEGYAEDYQSMLARLGKPNGN